MTEPSETEWQAAVVEAAEALGWAWLHVRKSVGKGKKWMTTTNIDGWPDLWLWHKRHGFAAIELKAHRNQPTPEQLQVLASLHAAGAAVLVAWPADWDLVQLVLQGRPVPPERLRTILNPAA